MSDDSGIGMDTVDVPNAAVSYAVASTDLQPVSGPEPDSTSDRKRFLENDLNCSDPDPDGDFEDYYHQSQTAKRMRTSTPKHDGPSTMEQSRSVDIGHRRPITVTATARLMVIRLWRPEMESEEPEVMVLFPRVIATIGHYRNEINSMVDNYGKLDDKYARAIGSSYVLTINPAYPCVGIRKFFRRRTRS